MKKIIVTEEQFRNLSEDDKVKNCKKCGKKLESDYTAIRSNRKTGDKYDYYCNPCADKKYKNSR